MELIGLAGELGVRMHGDPGKDFFVESLSIEIIGLKNVLQNS